MYWNLQVTNGWCCVHLKVLGCRAGGGTLTGPPVSPLIAGDQLVLLCQDVELGALEGGMDV